MTRIAECWSSLVNHFNYLTTQLFLSNLKYPLTRFSKGCYAYLMDKRYMAAILVAVGVIIYFFPQFSEITKDNREITGALFAIGGAILWYLPASKGKKN